MPRPRPGIGGVTNATSFETLLRGAADRAGVARLLAALGLEPPPPGWDDHDASVAAALNAAHGTGTGTDAAAPAGPVLIGVAGGLHAMLVELEEAATREAIAGIARRV